MKKIRVYSCLSCVHHLILTKAMHIVKMIKSCILLKFYLNGRTHGTPFVCYPYQSVCHCLTFFTYSTEHLKRFPPKSFCSVCRLLPFTNHKPQGSVAPTRFPALSSTQFIWALDSVVRLSRSLWPTHRGWSGINKQTRRLSTDLCVLLCWHCFHELCKKLQRFSASHSVG